MKVRVSHAASRYQPIRELGRGGMGVVYEVKDLQTGEHLALKEMLDPDARSLLRFKREFRVVAELRHENLVRLHDLGFADGTWFFTMELLRGRDLLQVVRPRLAAQGDAGNDTAEGPPPEETSADSPPGPQHAAGLTTTALTADQLDLIRDLLRQLLLALEYLHGHRIVHRDLKRGAVSVARA